MLISESITFDLECHITSVQTEHFSEQFIFSRFCSSAPFAVYTVQFKQTIDVQVAGEFSQLQGEGIFFVALQTQHELWKRCRYLRNKINVRVNYNRDSLSPHAIFSPRHYNISISWGLLDCVSSSQLSVPRMGTLGTVSA